MFKKVLLPVDLSDRHERALQVAADLARQAQGEIELLHVIEVMAGLSLEDEQQFYRRLESIAENHLAKLGQQLESAQVPWKRTVVFGSRGPEIVRHAAETNIEIIVLTSPQIDPAKPAVGWGSLSYKVGIMARCPVLLVK